MNIWIYLYGKFDLNECLIKYLYSKVFQYLNTFEYSNSFTLTNEYQNVFPKTKLTWTIVRTHSGEFCDFCDDGKSVDSGESYDSCEYGDSSKYGNSGESGNSG